MWVTLQLNENSSAATSVSRTRLTACSRHGFIAIPNQAIWQRLWSYSFLLTQLWARKINVKLPSWEREIRPANPGDNGHTRPWAGGFSKLAPKHWGTTWDSWESKMCRIPTWTGHRLADRAWDFDPMLPMPGHNF